MERVDHGTVHLLEFRQQRAIALRFSHRGERAGERKQNADESRRRGQGGNPERAGEDEEVGKKSSTSGPICS